MRIKGETGMLHMVVITHGPDTCAAVHPDIGDKARNAFGQMEGTSKRHQVSVQETWVDAPGHVFYLMADAPNAHAINDLMIELELFHWNTIDVHAVRTMDETLSLAASR